MSSDITIAVDAMGGDFGPSEIIPAIKYSVEKHEQLNIILVGKENLILEQLKISNSGLEKEKALLLKINDLEVKFASLFFAPLLTHIFPFTEVLLLSKLISLHF